MNFYLQSLLIISTFLNFYFNFLEKKYRQNKLKNTIFIIMNIIAIVYIIAYFYDFTAEITMKYHWYDYLLYFTTLVVYVLSLSRYYKVKNKS